jgi:hypothetical protein
MTLQRAPCWQFPGRLALTLIAALALAASLGAQAIPLRPSSLLPDISSSGSFSIIPVDTWGSGDFNALSDKWFENGNTPRVDEMSIAMDQTASTTYEGGLFFKRLKLKVGMDVDVDNNFIGKLNSIMGYINYSGFTLRVQKSELRGTATWTGDSTAVLAGMPATSAFDNPFISVDLLYYKGGGAIDYWGIGYTSYRLPVQLDCLTWDTIKQEIWYAHDVYQPDMAFQIYSGLFGLDTLYQSFSRTNIYAAIQGLGFWMATQDRAGVGISQISDQAEGWVAAANPGTTLWSSTQIAMLVDYNLTLGLQYVRSLGPVRLGLGLGFNLGGQMVLCITPKGPIDDPKKVDASPSFYLFHYGPIFKGMISW